MFKFTRKMNPNFEGVKSFCVKGEASRSRKDFGSGWAVSAARKMRLRWFLLTLLCPAFVSAQVSELWVARFHGSVIGSSDGTSAITADSSTGNVYVTGLSESPPSANSSGSIGSRYASKTVAYDSRGNQLWAAMDCSDQAPFKCGDPKA